MGQWRSRQGRALYFIKIPFTSPSASMPSPALCPGRLTITAGSSWVQAMLNIPGGEREDRERLGCLCFLDHSWGFASIWWDPWTKIKTLTASCVSRFHDHPSLHLFRPGCDDSVICFSIVCMHTKSIQSCLTLCDPMDCSPPGSFVHGSLQARIPEWVAMSSSRGSSRPRDQTCTSRFSCIAGRFVTTEPAGTLLFLDWGHFWGAFLPVACNSANGPFIKMSSDYPVWVWPLFSVGVRLTLDLLWP